MLRIVLKDATVVEAEVYLPVVGDYFLIIPRTGPSIRIMLKDVAGIGEKK